MKQLTLLEQLNFLESIEDRERVSHIENDIDKCFDINIKEFFVDVREVIKRDAKRYDKTEQEIREELNHLSTYRVPNSTTDLVSLKAVERVLNLVFRGCRDKEVNKQIECLKKISKILEEEEAKFRADYHDSINCPFEEGVLSAFNQFRLMILKESEEYDDPC